MLRLVVVLSASACLAACATSSSTPMTEIAGPSAGPGATAEVPEVQKDNVTVRVHNYEGGDIFEFDVKNLSAEPLVVDRDLVEMISPAGGRTRRLPGGAASAYSVPSAGAQQVNVRYDMSATTRGDLVRFDFSRAIQRVGGATLAIPHVVIKYH
jgi:hypothetical protein